MTLANRSIPCSAWTWIPTKHVNFMRQREGSLVRSPDATFLQGSPWFCWTSPMRPMAGGGPRFELQRCWDDGDKAAVCDT